MANLTSQLKGLVSTAKQYWHTPAKGNYVPYKEVVNLGAAGFGVHWATLLASTVGLDASNFLVGASIGLKPLDLYVMLLVANIVGIPITFFRGWLFDNHKMKGGKFIPFLLRCPYPFVVLSTIMVWLPFEQWQYTTKCVVVWFFFMAIQFFLVFYTDSFEYFKQIITPNAQERANVMSIVQIIYSMAPTVTSFVVPTIAGLTYGVNNIQTYRVIYPAFTVVGLVFSTIFFTKVKERLILPKHKIQQVRMFDALREIAKNKYWWIINGAGWIGFLEGAYGVILSWSFVYAFNGEKDAYLGLANTVISNAALWSMILAPFAIKLLGKRNLLIFCNVVNVVLFVIMFFGYKNLFVLCAILYLNGFVNTFGNINFPNIHADMRDYHQWKTGVRVDGMFGPMGVIGTIIGFGTGMVIPFIYETMGLKDDYNVLYDDLLRNNLFEVLIICSIIGSILNLIPFLFYDLTETKHEGYVRVLKIRAMFADFGANDLNDELLVESMEIINRSKQVADMSKLPIDKTALKLARKMPNKTSQDKQSRKAAIKQARADIKELRRLNEDIEIAPMVIDELDKFSTLRYQMQLDAAKEIVSLPKIYAYSDIKHLYSIARALPKQTPLQKAIRQDAIELVRSKKAATKLVLKYGAENIILPPESVAQEIENRETSSIKDTFKARQDMRAYTKAVSVYNRATAPYNNAQSLIKQSQNYTHFEELEQKYSALCTANI